MATAADVTVVETDRIVPRGAIDPDDVHLPGIYAKRIVVVPDAPQRHRAPQDAPRDAAEDLRRREDAAGTRMSWTREQMLVRAAAEVQPGQIVNLGIGMPTEIANYIAPDLGIMLQSENGLLGMGPYPTEDEVDARLINAGKETVTAVPGASLFDSAASFAMIRGGHVDLAILGGLEVACNGDLANWTVPGRLITGHGRRDGPGGRRAAAGGAAEPRLEGRKAQAGHPPEPARNRPRPASTA